jgi:hypothetical protein
VVEFRKFSDQDLAVFFQPGVSLEKPIAVARGAKTDMPIVPAQAEQ